MTRRLGTAVSALRARGATWLWLALAVLVGCGANAETSVTRDEPSTAVAASSDDSLAARALEANAREQSASATTTPQQSPRTNARPASPSSTDRATVFGPSIGFRSRQRLDDHFAKHGAEFGMISRAEYLRQAQALRDAPVGGNVLEIRRGDGTVSRFDKSSGAFLAFDDDGIIRTYFKPNDGERYFRRQARRRAGT